MNYVLRTFFNSNLDRIVAYLITSVLFIVSAHVYMFIIKPFHIKTNNIVYLFYYMY